MPSILFDIELEQPIPAVADIYRSRDSCMVDACVDQLDAIATRLGQPRIKDFGSRGWYGAAEGLAVFQALKAFLEQSPAAAFQDDYKLTRLRLWERMLQAAQSAGVRWQLSAELA